MGNRLPQGTFMSPWKPHIGISCKLCELCGGNWQGRNKTDNVDNSTYRTALDLLHWKCMESYNATWGHIALFVSHCSYRTVCIALYVFTHVLQVNMCFLYVQTRHIQILHYFICQVFFCTYTRITLKCARKQRHQKYNQPNYQLKESHVSEYLCLCSISMVLIPTLSCSNVYSGEHRSKVLLVH